MYWNHDYALRLSPLPHVLVLAEGGRGPAKLELNGVQMLCPGSFSRETNFLFYAPALREATVDCSVDQRE